MKTKSLRDDVPEGSHLYRVARLDLPDEEASSETLPQGAERLPVHGRPEWDAVVREVMTRLAPQGEREAALTLVQGQEIVFGLTPGRSLEVHRLESKPAALHVTRFVGEGEFAANAEAVLRFLYPGEEYLLFQSGDESQDVSFVFFDLPHRKSVLIVAPSTDGRGPRAARARHRAAPARTWLCAPAGGAEAIRSTSTTCPASTTSGPSLSSCAASRMRQRASLE